MTYNSVTHVALHVGSLPEAEEFYRELFGMDVVLREEIVMFTRDAFSLALEPTEKTVGEGGPLAHVGLFVDEREMERLDHEAKRLGCKVARVRPDLLVFWDRFGVQWEITTIWPPGAVKDRTAGGL